MTNYNNIEEERLNYMKYRVLQLEKQNYKSHDYSASGMVDKIRNIIVEEADKKIIRK